jgi:hypothetical protein
VNVRVPGQPLIVQQYNYDQLNQTIPSGQALDFSVPNLPVTTGVLVQFLAVYNSSTQGTQSVEYGDSTVDLQSGDVAVNITANVVSSGVSQGRVQGRYISGGTTWANSYGPSGTLITYFQPPDGTPPMAVNQDYIYNGWFNIFVVDSTSASLSYVIQETGQTLFSNVTLNSDSFTPSTYLVHFLKPVSFRRNGLADPQEDYFQGFIAAPGVPTSVTSALQACYPSYNETLPGLLADAQGLEQLDYNPSQIGSTSAFALAADSGVAASYAMDYVTGTCEWSNGATNFYPEHIATDGADTGAFGVQGPFRMISPFRFGDGAYLEANYITANNNILLAWAYLPSVIYPTPNQTPAVDGSTVFAAFSTGQTGVSWNSNSNTTCDQVAIQNGFAAIADVAGTSTTPESFTLDSSYSVGGQTLGIANYQQFQFAVCPFHLVNGAKVYFQAGIHNECTGENCNNNIVPYGWADASSGDGSQQISVSTSYTAAPLNGRTALLSQVQINAQLDSFRSSTLTLSSANSIFAPNDEIMIQVVGAGHSGDCQADAAYPVQVGQVWYTRVLDAPTSTQLIIPGDGLATILPGSAILSATPSVGTTFCLVQIARVLQFQDLTISSGGQITATPFSFATGGGVLPIRVSGTLTIQGASIAMSATGAGFPGGTSYDNGAGWSGNVSPASMTVLSNAGPGSTGTPSGAGGAGFGNGGVSPVANGGIGNTFAGPMTALFGGGGGAGASYAGGAGGGAIVLAARNVNLMSNTVIDASGVAGTSASASSGGAGGGGQVMFISDNLGSSASNTISLSANGGPNNDTTANSGTGGGGFVASLICLNSGASINMAGVLGGPDALAGGGGAHVGLNGAALAVPPNESPYCPTP